MLFVLGLAEESRGLGKTPGVVVALSVVGAASTEVSALDGETSTVSTAGLSPGSGDAPGSSCAKAGTAIRQPTAAIDAPLIS